MEAEEFNTVEFEKRLTCLKDTQESIQETSTWCLQQRAHHKRIVSSWLNVLKQVRIEHRLTLFYLANDVIQYSKRKGYEFVDSWGTTLQRATTMVRDEKVKHKIVRIFQIWRQRDIYNEEFLADLNGLLSINPVKKTATDTEEEFQTAGLSNIINKCLKLEKETDRSFKLLAKAPPLDFDELTMLKDRKHVEDSERDVERHVAKLETYLKHLASEIKARKVLISAVEQADSFFTNQRSEVKVVVKAYKKYGDTLKAVKRKIEEVSPNLPSPIPSPDINAPSPEPDNDFLLPGEPNNYFGLHNNGFLGYMDSNALPFNINDFGADVKPKRDNYNNQPIEVINSRQSDDEKSDYKPSPQPVPPVDNLPLYVNQLPPSNYQPGFSVQSQMPSNHNSNSMTSYPSNTTANYYQPTEPSTSYNMNQSIPINPVFNAPPPFNPTIAPPPPMPNFNQDFLGGMDNYDNNRPLIPPPMPPTLDRTEDFASDSWPGLSDGGWNSSQEQNFDRMENPVSPLSYGHDSMSSSHEYGDNHSLGNDMLGNIGDVDHRIKTPKVPLGNINDHRNLISLTGPPSNMKKNKSMSPTKTAMQMFWDKPPPKIINTMQPPPNPLLPPPLPPQIPNDIPSLMDIRIGAPDINSNENMEQRNVGIDRTSSQSVVTPFSASPVKKVSIPPRPSPFAKNKNDNVESVDMEMSDEDVDDKSLANPLEIVNDNDPNNFNAVMDFNAMPPGDFNSPQSWGGNNGMETPPITPVWCETTGNQLLYPGAPVSGNRLPAQLSQQRFPPPMGFRNNGRGRGANNSPFFRGRGGNNGTNNGNNIRNQFRGGFRGGRNNW